MEKGQCVDLSNKLISIILNGLIDSPNFINELPIVLIGLETGKNVIIDDKISSESGRLVIEKLFELFPLLVSEYNCDLKHLRKLIIKILNKYGYIKNPSQLHPHELHICKTSTMILFELLLQFPDIKFELNSLLDNILYQERHAEPNQDNIIDLNGLGNSRLSSMVGRLLVSLGLNCVANTGPVHNSFTVQDSDESDDEVENQHTYKFPSSHSDRRKAVESIRCFMNVLVSYAPKSVTVASRSNRKRSRSNSSSGNSSSSGGFDSDDSSSVRVGVKVDQRTLPDSEIGLPESNKRVTIGPSIPTKEDLEQLQLNPMGVVPSDSEEDEDAGPQLTGRVYIEPLGGSAPVVNTGKSEGQGTSQPVADGTQREEWMVVPGLKDPFGSAISDPASVLTNKGFQTGKLAKKAAEAVDARSEAMREADNAANAEKNRQTQELLDQYRSQRGPSLMDAHLENKKNGKSRASRSNLNSNSSGRGRHSFDREEDMLSRGPLSAKETHDMVQEAKQLDSRFSKGSVQKQF